MGKKSQVNRVTIFCQCKINNQAFFMGGFRKLCQLSDKWWFSYGSMLDNPSCCSSISLNKGRDHRLAVTAFFDNNFHIFSYLKVNISSGRYIRVCSQQWGSIYCYCHVHLHWRTWARCSGRLLYKVLSGRLNIICAIIILFFNTHRWL